MKQIKALLLVSLLYGFYHAEGQKTTDGIKFSTCLNNKELSPRFYKDKYLVLDFWATWCGPCIASFPKVSALQEKYGNNPKIVFAAITTERSGMVDSFFHRKKNMMPGVWQLIDDTAATWQYFEVNTIPRLLVFAPSGKIVFSGRAEDLAGCMDTLLKGADMYKEPVHEQPTTDKWDQYQQTASFIAIAGPASTKDGGGSNINFNTDYSRVLFNVSNETLADVLGYMCRLPSLHFTYNDSVKAHQMISVCYKQVSNDFPVFDSGLLGYEYQNHILNLLENIYSFHSEWVKEQVTAYKIVVKDKDLLAAAATLSTHGSYGSTNDRVKKTHTYVNQTLKSMAANAEDYLDIPFFADEGVAGYDLEVSFFSLPDFEKSLSKYGLAVEKTDRYEMKKIKITFH